MCCGNRIVERQQAAGPAPAWDVLDANQVVVTTKTSEIAAKLAAARIGGTVRQKP